MPGSVQLATILFTDLVGSTELATAVGPQRADELRSDHFAVLREAIDATGGTEVKNTGDGLMVAFDSASAAVRCGVLMQQLLERRHRRLPPRLHIRIGLGAGESTVEESDYFGMPTVAAARLCDKAPSDGILASSVVRMLAGRAEGAVFQSVGALELKGISEPVEAFRVAWEPLAEESPDAIGRWPLPPQLQSVPRVSYVGRIDERASIERARGEARGGKRQLVLLAGEPGIGKTRLAAYEAHGARGEGFAVCWGGSSEDLAVPFEPWIEVCLQLVEHAPQEVLDSYVEHFGGELGRLAHNLSRRVPAAPPPQTSDPETERYLLFGAVAGLLQAVSESTPLCAVLDDLHWSDGQTVALLKHVVRTNRTGALQVIVTYRDSDLTADHPLTAALADFARIDGVQRIALRGLDVDEVAEMMSATAGHDLNEDGIGLASEIATETAGNPFFVGEILRSLVESETLVFEDESGRWSVDRSVQLQLPQSVRDVVDRRVRRLGEEARQILTAGAVIGNSFDVELVTELADASESRVLDELEAAVAASVLTESTERVGRFAFGHALIRQSLYDGLGATRRARMHHRVAMALEELGAAGDEDRLGELALHWRLATVSVDTGKAAEYARRAGEQALERLAPGEAVKLFSDALELIGEADSIERCRALAGLGEAQRQTGEGPYRETLLEASRVAFELRDAGLAASSALANNRGSYSVIGQIDEERLEAIERALALDEPTVPERRALLLALQAQELEWGADHERRWALADEAVELARAAGDQRTLAGVLRNAFYAYWAPETLPKRLAVTDELIEAAAVAGDPALRYWSHMVQFNCSFEAADLATAEAAIHRTVILGEELSQPLLEWTAIASLAGWHLERGEFAAAEREAERAFQAGQQAGEPDAVMMYGLHLSTLKSYRGEGEEIIEMLEQSVANYPLIPAWRAGLGHAYVLLGRNDEARGIVERAASEGFRDIPHDQTGPMALVLYASVAGQERLPQAAGQLHDLIEPWKDSVVWTGATGFGHARMSLALLASVLGRHERADDDFAFATEFQEANGLLYWAAYAHLLWAESLHARGDTDRARREGARALELCREHGYGALEGRAAAVVEGSARAPAG